MSGLALGATGPGKASLDNALGFEWVSGIGSFLITAIVGLGGAALLLVVFWRPAKKA
jgi:putative oxidoreductase